MGDDFKSITDHLPVNIDKASKWTVFLLVDLRIIFIITYAFVSVVNLISTTANGEATEDTHSTRLFTVTSRPEHVDVNVSFIDDAILWNCRDHSVTRHYYRGLYWMLISAFSTTMLAFIITKVTVILGAKHGHLFLWKLAVIKSMKQMKSKLDNDKLEEYAKIMEQLSEENNPDDKVRSEDKIKMKCCNILRVTSQCASVVILFMGIVLTFLFYDLHPLSCIHGQREKYIDYDETNKSVKIHFSDSILGAQKGVGVILPILALLFMLCAFIFYCSSVCIIDIYVRCVNNDETDNDGHKCYSCCRCEPLDVLLYM